MKVIRRMQFFVSVFSFFSMSTSIALTVLIMQITAKQYVEISIFTLHGCLQL